MLKLVTAKVGIFVSWVSRSVSNWSPKYGLEVVRWTKSTSKLNIYIYSAYSGAAPGQREKEGWCY
jgi:hypothetical protein